MEKGHRNPATQRATMGASVLSFRPASAAGDHVSLAASSGIGARYCLCFLASFEMQCPGFGYDYARSYSVFRQGSVFENCPAMARMLSTKLDTPSQPRKRELEKGWLNVMLQLASIKIEV